MKVHSLQQSVVASASTAATGYPATNTSVTQVGKPWRSTVTTETTVTLDAGASFTPASLCIQDANFASAPVTYSADNVTYYAAGTLTTYADLNGRRKGSLEFANTCRYIKITIASGTPTDSAAYWSIGAAYVFKTVETADMAPSVGLSQEVVYPQASYELANGRTVTAELGNKFTLLSGQTPNRPADGAGDVVALARAGSIWIDMEITANRDRQWPMKFYDGRFTQTIDEALWPASFSLKEVV